MGVRFASIIYMLQMERYSPQYLGDVHYFSDHNFFVLFIYGVLAITSLFLFYLSIRCPFSPAATLYLQRRAAPALLNSGYRLHRPPMLLININEEVRKTNTPVYNIAMAKKALKSSAPTLVVLYTPCAHQCIVFINLAAVL